MKAILMAAGKGTRISRYIGDIPKCCAKVGDESIIQRTVRILQKIGIQDVSIVLGYKDELVRKEIEKYDVKIYYNPFFNFTNSIASLWFAREEISVDDDVIIMNGDLFFEEKLITTIKDSDSEIVMFADPRRKSEADYRFQYVNGILKNFGKDLSDEQTDGEYIGIARIKPSVIPMFKKNMDFLIRQQEYNFWWEDILYDLSKKGIIINVHEITDCFWAELDYVEDYSRIKEFLNRNIS